MRFEKILGIVATLISLTSSALAQNSGSVTNHAFAIGKGPGVTGYTSLLCAAGQFPLGQASADPVCTSASGIDTNALGNGGAAVTSPYTVQASDCGTILQLGTGANTSFTLTLPSTAGFPANCAVAIHNVDLGRGKVLSGFPGDFGSGSNILWPDQFGTVRIVSGAWQSGVNPGVWQAAGSVTLNVNHASGSDTNNDCLGTGAGACATIYHAYLLMQTYVRPAIGGSANITETAETFTETPPAAFLGPTLTAGSNGGVLFLNLNGSTWNTAGINIDDGAVISIGGGTIQCTGSGNTAVSVPKGGLFVIGSGLTFGACTAGAHMQVFNSANIVADFGYTVSGTANFHAICNNGGNFNVSGKTISVPNALAFTSWISGNGNCNAGFTGTTFTGTGAGAGSTGTKYDFHSGADIVLNGAVLPGASGGTLDTNACLDLIGSCAGTPITAHNVVIGNGNGVYNSAAAGATGQVLTGVTGSDPTFQSAKHSAFGNSPSLSQNTTNFCGAATCGAGNGATSIIWPFSGTLRNLYVIASVAPAAGQTYIITINNGGASTVTCTISNPATSCTPDTTHTSAYTAGNGVWFQIALSATSGAAQFAYAIELDTP